MWWELRKHLEMAAWWWTSKTIIRQSTILYATSRPNCSFVLVSTSLWAVCEEHAVHLTLSGEQKFGGPVERTRPLHRWTWSHIADVANDGTPDCRVGLLLTAVSLYLPYLSLTTHEDVDTRPPFPPPAELEMQSGLDGIRCRPKPLHPL